MLTLCGVPGSSLANAIVNARFAGAARQSVSKAVFAAVIRRLVPEGLEVACVEPPPPPHAASEAASSISTRADRRVTNPSPRPCEHLGAYRVPDEIAAAWA